MKNLKILTMFFLTMLFMALINSCIISTVPGSSRYSHQVRTGDYYTTVSKPPLLPTKDDTESYMDSDALLKALNYSSTIPYFKDKKIYILLKRHEWSLEYQKTTTGIFGEVAGHFGNVHANRWKWHVFAPLHNFLNANQIFKDFQIGKADKPSNPDFDYMVYFAKSVDEGTGTISGALGLLCPFTLAITPCATDQDTAIYMHIYDANYKHLGSSSITITKTSYIGLFTLFMPFWWGDSDPIEPKTGSLFMYLLDSASRELRRQK